MGVTFHTTAAAAPTGPRLTLGDCRSIVRLFARNADDSSMYPDAQIDIAVQAVLDDFVARTGCTKRIDVLTLTAHDPDLPALPAGFRPDLLQSAWVIDGEPLDVIDYESLLSRRKQYGSAEGTPTAIAFKDWQTGEAYPTPDVDTTLSVRWTKPVTVPTDPAEAVDLPPEWVRQGLAYGATAFLQHTEKQNAYASESWKKYLAFVATVRGAGNLGARTAKRDRVCW